MTRFRLFLMSIVAVFAAAFGITLFAVDANLSATAPTLNSDGTALTDLATLKFYKLVLPTAGACPTTLASYTAVGTKPATNGAAVTYLDASIANGRNCYVVTALDAGGNESAPSAPAFKDADLIAPRAPTNLTVN